MGAAVFFTEAIGVEPEKAFRCAVQEASYAHGHEGYTGSIAEKDKFNLITLPKGKDAYEFANQLVDNGDPRVDDKWGPAGCIDITDTSRGYEKKQKLAEDQRIYLFFGWASE